jgi:hypothetical protein
MTTIDQQALEACKTRIQQGLAGGADEATIRANLLCNCSHGGFDREVVDRAFYEMSGVIALADMGRRK